MGLRWRRGRGLMWWLRPLSSRGAWTALRSLGGMLMTMLYICSRANYGFWCTQRVLGRVGGI